MHRRQLLRGATAGALAATAGCLMGYRGSSSPGQVRPPTGGPPVELPVTSGIRWPLAKDAIPAIVDPAFAPDWRGIDVPGRERSTLSDDAAVVGVDHRGTARAYPLAVLDRHEVVNDTVGGTPLLVSYCPLCGSAVVARRLVDGDPTVFGVSGALWRKDLVLYDRATGSLWSQLLATAIRGPQTGEQLELVPSRLTSWRAWREGHPETELLLPPPHSGTIDGSPPEDYSPKYPYGDERQLVGFDADVDGNADTDAEGLGARTLVLGVVRGDTARAYPYVAVRRAGGVVNDRVGDLPLVVTTTPGGGLAAYDRRIGDRTLRFAGSDGGPLRADGSRWRRETGRALDGPHEGQQLPRANELPPMFWHAWRSFHPGTGVYGRGSE